jgi:hypothetical protein
MKYGYDRNGKPFLTKEPKLLLNDDNQGVEEGGARLREVQFGGKDLLLGDRASGSTTSPATCSTTGAQAGRQMARWPATNLLP